MQRQLLATVTANGNTDVTIDHVSPFMRGSNACLLLAPNSAFDGTIAFSDADADGSTYVDQVAAVDLTGGVILLENVTIPTLARVTGASILAGACKVYLVVED